MTSVLDIKTGVLYTALMTNAKHFWRLAVLIAIYALLLFASVWLLRRDFVTGIWRIPVGLIPMLPAIGILLNYMERFRTFDELQRNIQSEGLSFSVGATAIITFSYGFLQTSIGAPNISFFWVWPILAMTWMIGTMLAWRRYR